MAQQAAHNKKTRADRWRRSALHPADLDAPPSLLKKDNKFIAIDKILLFLQPLTVLAALIASALPTLRIQPSAIRFIAALAALDLLLDLIGRLQLFPLRLRAREAWREAASLSTLAALLLFPAAHSPLLAAISQPLFLLIPLFAASLLPLRPAMASSAVAGLLLALQFLHPAYAPIGPAAPSHAAVPAWPVALAWLAASLLIAALARLRLYAATQRARDRAEVNSSMRVQRLLDDARTYRLTGARGEADFDLKRPLAGALSIRENVNKITELIHRFFTPRSSQLWWLDDSRQQLRLRAQRGDAGLAANTTRPSGQGLLGSVIKTRAPVNLHHLRPDFEGLNFYPGQQAPPAVLAVPVLEGEHPRGVLLVDKIGADDVFSRADQALLANLAEQVMQAIEVERVFAVMEKDQHSQDALLQLTEALNGALTLDASLDAIVNGVQQIAQADLAAVVLRESNKLVVRRVAGSLAAASMHDQALSPENSLVGSAIRSQAALPARANLLGSERRIVLLSEQLDPRGLQRGKVIPLLHQGEAIGALVLASQQPDSLSDEVIRLLQVAAGYGTISLVNAQLYAKMEHMATRDGLTGLINHRTFQEQLEGALARSMRFNQALTLMLCDIDHFKNVNDTYGHPTGDEVLRRVSAALVEESRSTDVVARYGGEEFTIIMEATDAAGALQVAERIRRSVEAQQTETANGPLKVTLSAGLATFPQDAEQQADLIKAADETLYLAKNQGRNRCLHRQHTRGKT